MPLSRTHPYHLRATEQRQAHKQRIAQRIATSLRIAQIKKLEREKQQCIERVIEQMQIAKKLRMEKERTAIKNAEDHLHIMLLESYLRKKQLKGKQSKEERKKNYAEDRKSVLDNFSSEVQYVKRKFLIA